MLRFSIATTMTHILFMAFLANLGPLVPCLGADVAAVDGQKPIPSGRPKLSRKQGTVFWSIKCELQDKAGNLWFSAGDQGVYRFDGAAFTNFTTRDGLPDNEVSAIIESKSGSLVFGTKSGVGKYDGKAFSRYGENSELAKIPVTCLLEDKEGHLWIGTLTRGVYRYDGKALTNFLNEGSGPFNLGRPYQTILDILQDKQGNLWFSSWNGGGVWRYDGRSFENLVPSVDYYLRNEDGRSGDRKPPSPASNRPDPLPPQATITDDMIFSMAEDEAGNLWLATRNHGACRYDGKAFTTFAGNESVYSVFEDSRGHMWFTTNDHGVWRYDGKSFENFTTKNGLVNNSVFSVLEDRSGNLWFGTRDCGLSRFDGKTFLSFSD
jgi:ligand-binding sensor domain-containing protein